jgi:hypothetical protein
VVQFIFQTETLHATLFPFAATFKAFASFEKITRVHDGSFDSSIQKAISLTKKLITIKNFKT